MKRLGLIVGTLIVATACGSDAPTAPSIAQVAGLWNGTVRLATVSGGECVGTLLLNTPAAASAISVSIAQAGASLSGTITNQGTGSTCGFTGTAGGSSVSMIVTQCQIGSLLGIRCLNGALRDIQIVAGSANASVSGNSMSGSETEVWNVFVSGTAAGAGILTVSSTFNVSR